MALSRWVHWQFGQHFCLPCLQLSRFLTLGTEMAPEMHAAVGTRSFRQPVLDAEHASSLHGQEALAAEAAAPGEIATQPAEKPIGGEVDEVTRSGIARQSSAVFGIEQTGYPTSYAARFSIFCATIKTEAPVLS